MKIIIKKLKKKNIKIKTKSETEKSNYMSALCHQTNFVTKFNMHYKNVVSL